MSSLFFSHIKWFVDSQELLRDKPATWPWSFTEILVASLLALAVIVVVMVFEKRYIPAPSAKYIKTVTAWRPSINKIFAALIGIFLICIGLFWDVILTPELVVNDSTTEVLRALEVFTGFLFLTGMRRVILLATYLTVGLFATTGVLAGPVFWLENIVFVGAALYLITNFTASKSFKKQWGELAVPVLRVTTGITLIAFAFSEKLVHPYLSDVFLDEHGWNFIHRLGFDWFTNEYFILTAGFVESVFGILLIMGVATRLTTLALGGLFATSVTAMLIQKGEWEVEDLPVYAVAIVLVAYGSGSRLLFKKKTQKTVAAKFSAKKAPTKKAASKKTSAKK